MLEDILQDHEGGESGQQQRRAVIEQLERRLRGARQQIVSPLGNNDGGSLVDFVLPQIRRVQMNRTKSLLSMLIGAVVWLVAAPTMAQDKKPNVVFILADNVGYGDLGSYGGGELRGAPTPRLDQLAREGLRLTQFLVEPACTPSRAALMTGQYSIRNGLSLIAIAGSPYHASRQGVHDGSAVQGCRLRHGNLREVAPRQWTRRACRRRTASMSSMAFRRTSPGTAATYVSTIELTHSIPAPPAELLAKGPQIVEATAGGPLRTVKPFTPEVRAEIDNELVAKSIDFMRRQKEAGKPFFLYLPFSMGHAPNLPSAEFKGKSRIGNYGDKLMEGDHHVGQILDTLKELGVEDNTIVVFASDNGPYGETAREFGNEGTPDMGNSGPFRGELGEVTEGSIRTAAIIRWPGKVKPDTTSYAMFSIMDFLPTFAHIVGGSCQPTGRSTASISMTCCWARAPWDTARAC